MFESIVAQKTVDVKSELPATRNCCVCGGPFAPDDELQVLCPSCEALGIRCGCVMLWQSCAVCEAVKALAKGELDPILDLGWHGYAIEEVNL